jgi:hypothetical protein
MYFFAITRPQYDQEESFLDAARLESYRFEFIAAPNVNPFHSAVPVLAPTSFSQSIFYYCNYYLQIVRATATASEENAQAGTLYADQVDKIPFIRLIRESQV